jgi:hypothetical protein
MRGIVHRDIKDENVMLSANGERCWLVDFGSAGVVRRAGWNNFSGMCTPPPFFSFTDSTTRTPRSSAASPTGQRTGFLGVRRRRVRLPRRRVPVCHVQAGLALGSAALAALEARCGGRGGGQSEGEGGGEGGEGGGRRRGGRRCTRRCRCPCHPVLERRGHETTHCRGDFALEIFEWRVGDGLPRA